MEGVIRQYNVENNGVTMGVVITRADGKHDLPPFHGLKRERNRRAIKASISVSTNGLTPGGVLKVFTGISICRPPDKFDEKLGMTMALKDAVKQLMEGGLVPNEKKGEVAEVIFDGFRNYIYYKEKAKKEAKKVAATPKTA